MAPLPRRKSDGLASYVQLVRENREFRQLWIAAVISMLGEWFNTIALFFLILEYTGSEFLLGMLFTVRMAGFAILAAVHWAACRPIQQKDAHGGLKFAASRFCFVLLAGQ